MLDKLVGLIWFAVVGRLDCSTGWASGLTALNQWVELGYMVRCIRVDDLDTLVAVGWALVEHAGCIVE